MSADHEIPVDMVLVMGVTGAGKSYFVNQLQQGAVIEGEGLESTTTTCQVVEADLGNTKVAVVDCPGFNDTYRSSIEILEEIARILCTQSALGKTLRVKGIIYLHSLEKERMEASDMEAFRLLQELVGVSKLGHVYLATTKWGNFHSNNRTLAFKRENQLREIFWRSVVEKGAQMGRFDGDTASAQGIVANIIQMDEVTTALQHELVKEGRKLYHTSAGALLGPQLEREEADIRRELGELAAQVKAEKNETKRIAALYHQQIATEKNARIIADRTRLENPVHKQTRAAIAERRKHSQKYSWRGDLQLFCNVLGVGLAIVTPLAACSIM